MKLNPSDIEAYKGDGVIVLRDAFSPEAIAALTKGVNGAIANIDERSANIPIGAKGKTFVNAHFAALTTPEMRDFIGQTSMAQIIKDLTGSKTVGLLYDHLIVKEP